MWSTRPSTARKGHFLGDTEPYDAVILDVGLPLMDGISVVERWRRAGRKMPVLILTARDRWSDKVSGIDAGADDYVTKPFHNRGSAGAPAGPDPPRRRPRLVGTDLRAAAARHQGVEGRCRRRAAEAHLARVPPCSPISCTTWARWLSAHELVEISTTRISTGIPTRSSVCRTPAQEDGHRHDRDGSRHGLPDARARRV